MSYDLTQSKGTRSLCRSPKTNKKTCPLNPVASSVDNVKHQCGSTPSVKFAATTKVAIPSSKDLIRYPSTLPNFGNVENFYTHDNGGRPFRIKINKNKVEVYKLDVTIFDRDDFDEDDFECNREKYYDLLFKICSKRIFVGEDVYRDFRGNSILLKLSKNQYMHIGSNIFKFKTDAPIVEYYSPVGNSDVPYPWAVDSEGRCYLMIEGKILLTIIDDVSNPEFEPYDKYYSNCKGERSISLDMEVINPRLL